MVILSVMLENITVTHTYTSACTLLREEMLVAVYFSISSLKEVSHPLVVLYPAHHRLICFQHHNELCQISLCSKLIHPP